MAENESFLHENEERALAVGAGDLLRTDALLSVQRFLEDLGLSPEAQKEITDRVSEKLDDVSDKDARKVAKSLGRVSSIFTVEVAGSEEQMVEEAVATDSSPVEEIVDLAHLSQDELAAQAEGAAAEQEAEEKLVELATDIVQEAEVETEKHAEPAVVFEVSGEPEGEPGEPETPYERIAHVWFEDEVEAAAFSEHINPSAKLTEESIAAGQAAAARFRDMVSFFDTLEKVVQFTPQELINVRTLLGWFKSIDGEERYVAATPLSKMLKAKGFTTAKREAVAEAVHNGLVKLTDSIE